MIKKNDLIILLTEMQEKGIDVKDALLKTIRSTDIPLDVLKYINDNRQLDVAVFYNGLRKSYNEKRSPLYHNIVKEDIEPNEALTTLASLHLQLLLFSKKLDDPTMFFNHIRAEEITRVLNNYYKTYDISSCIKLLKLIKADLKCFETIR